MIKAIAIDDEPLPLELLQEYCSQTKFINLERTFTKITDAQKYLHNYSVDLLFLDIKMPKLSGVEFCKSLKPETMVIFTTAFSQYAVEGFNLNAVDFLLKPFSLDRFLIAINKANDYYNYHHKKEFSDIQHLYVRSNYSLHKISVDDILFIESFADYLNIHIINNKTITTRMTLKNIIEKLPQNDFIRVHRSYIVPLKRIERINKKTIFISKKEIPIGTNYCEEFFARFGT